MDLLDKKILCALDMNCRQSYARIAKQINSSRAVVNYRIKNLEKAGIIRSYITAINLGKLGFNTYKVFFKLHTSNERAIKQFIEHLKASRNVIHCLKTEGAYDVSIAVAVKTIKEFDEFMTDLKNKFNELIKDYYISLVIKSKVFRLQKILLGKKAYIKTESYSGKDTSTRIDSNDKKLLKILSNNASIHLVDLAKKTKLTVDIAKYRMKKLVQGNIINNFRMMLDFNKMGLYHYVVLLKIRKATKQEEAKLMEWARSHPSVLYLVKYIGNWDYAINVALRNIDEYTEFISAFRKEFSDIIDSYETSMNTEILKLNYCPLY